MSAARSDAAQVALRQADPTRSDRQIAAAVGVAPNTVTATREVMEGTAQIAQLAATTGADGKVRPRNPYHEKRYAAIDAELLRDPFRLTSRGSVA